MSRAMVEEVSDSDLSDPGEGDIDDFLEADIMRQVVKPQTSSTPSASASTSKPSNPPQRSAAPLVHPSQVPGPQVQPADIKDYQCIYPIYFDASRSRGEGRRVSSALAVRNPLAREIATACAQLRLQPVFEAHRTHPADWANPGRVRVPLKKLKQSGAAGSGAANVKNKHHLYALIAEHLRRNPTTDKSEALRRGVRVAGLGGPHLDDDEQPWPHPAVPRGWKMGDLLPAYSAAMTGGGVSENAFKDMMKEMQQGGGPGGPGGPGGGMPALPPGMGNMAEMMNMFGGMGGGPGPSGGGGEAAGGGGGKKGKKGKK